ncbi:MAG: tryptophan synthase subunit alpha [Candidatus Taylorbacteria bacterium]
MKKVRGHFEVLVAVGFGISTPDQVRELSKHADIAVVGSAIIQTINSLTSNSLLIDIFRIVDSYAKETLIHEKIT